MIDLRVKNQTQTLADFLRSDKLFRSKNITNSNLRKLLAGLAIEIGRTEGAYSDIAENYYPDNTTLLEEWEAALGIPDDCFFIAYTTAQRIRNILTKLTALGVSTKSGFEALAATFGLTVEVYPGVEKLALPLTFPIPFTNTIPRWTMYILAPADAQVNTFPFTFPYSFRTNSDTSTLICLFQKLAPDNVKVLFNFVL